MEKTTCGWCRRRCANQFCDDICEAEYKEEEAIVLESKKEDLPAQSYYDSFYEPCEWDVVGGL